MHFAQRSRASSSPRLFSAALVAISFLSAACDAPVAPLRNAAPAAPRLAVITNPRATFTYYNQSPAERLDATISGFITGDNRAAGGTSLPDSSVYDDGRCGVQAQVFVGGSGDATLDPTDMRVANCNNSTRRAIRLTYGTPIVGAAGGSVTAGHFTNVREVEKLPYVEGGSNVSQRRFRLQPRGTTPCDWVRYGTTVGTEHTDFTVKIGGVDVVSKPARLEAVAPGVWIASSQPNADGKHVAVCEVAAGRGTSYTAAYDIPFRIRVVMR